MTTKLNKTKHIGIDDTDEKILNELIEDAKMPLRKLATKLSISSVTAMNRIRRMEKAGVIVGYFPKINYEKLGYDIHVLIDVRISKGKLLELEKKIARHPNIYAVYDSTGGFDATVLGKFRSTRTMDTFLKKIQTFDFVERTNTKMILNTIKEAQIRL